MAQPITLGYSMAEQDTDYEDDFREAAIAARDREAEEIRDMEADDRQMEVLERLAYDVGVGCPRDVINVSEHVKFVVFDSECARALKTLVPVDKVAQVPLRNLDTLELKPTEIWVTGRAGMAKSEPDGHCFWVLCRSLGVDVDTDCTSPSMLCEEDMDELMKHARDRSVLVQRDACSVSHYRNHVQLVDRVPRFAWTKMECAARKGELMYQSCMSIADFLRPGFATYVTNYFSQSGQGGFGSLTGGVDPFITRGSDDGPGSAPPDLDRSRAGHAGSVRAESVNPGSTNVSQGVVRHHRRNIAAKGNYSYGGAQVNRSYAVSPGVMFNNLSEVALDSISPEYAQDILEALFDQWGLGAGSPEVMKYAEDLVFTFVIATTASDKADYNRSYDIPSTRGVTLVADFKVLSDMLIMKYGLTRRQFVRGLADRLRSFARHDENAELRSGMADRAGCQMQFSDLAFDGSTHCRGMGPTEKAFVKTLEARNLFEQDGVLAVDASNKLLTGFSQRAQRQLA